MSPNVGKTKVSQAIGLRRSAATATAQLPVDAIPDGPEMLNDLLEVLRDSIAADRDFIGWMSDMTAAGTCPISTDSDGSYQAAVRNSSRAVAEKDQFLQVWNPLARRFGQPVFTEAEI